MKTLFVHKFLKFYRNLSIKRKLLLVLNIQILIPLLLIGFLTYQKSAAIIEEKSIGYSRDILQMIELRLRDCINNLKMVSDDLLFKRPIYDVLDYDSLTYDPLTIYEKEYALYNILKDVYLSRNEIQSICLVSNDKKYYSADRDRRFGIEDIIKPIYPQILEQARQGHGQPVWYLENDRDKVEHVFLTRTINSRDTYKEIGLMVIMVKKESLETVYHDLSTEITENIAIVSNDQKVIVSRSSSDNSLKELMGIDAMEGLGNGNGVFTDDENDILFSYVTMEQPGWKVVTFIPMSDLFREIDVLRYWFVIMCAVSVAVLSFLSVIIAVDFIKPINRLVHAMENAHQGNGGMDVVVDRDDELGFLSKTYNKMVQEINHLVKWIYREQITRKEAEIKALQSQINPHFLFNTLESINWMARLNNVPEISETVEGLSSLMEANIGRDDKLIAIEEEINYIDNYISIIKKRYDDRLTLVKDIQPQVMDIKIPRLLIQPLIENAVYHGIEKTRRKGEIHIKAYIEGELMTIEVMDNGMGMDKDELEIINEKLSVDNDTYFRSLGSKSNKSIGIENVNRRIKLFYGEEYGLRIESQKGEYTRAIVTIPVHRQEPEEAFYVQGFNY